MDPQTVKLAVLGPFKRVLRTTLHSLGAIHLFRLRTRKALRILTYHHFPQDLSGLRRQCEHIRRFYTPVSMTQVSDALAGNFILPHNSVAVTIDDGYRDFLSNAYPVFSEFRIPTTVFLVSDFLDRKRWMWWNEVEYALTNTGKSSVTALFDGERKQVPVRGGSQADLLSAIVEGMKKLSNQERMNEMARLFAELDVTIPGPLPAEWEPLTWEEVRTLARTTVEFGAHTKTHPILSSLHQTEALEEEIRGSQRRVEQELGAPVLHFSYPNGLVGDISSEAVRITASSGFRTAVTAIRGMNEIGKVDAYQLKRFSVDPYLPDYYFAELLAGVRSM